MKKILISEYDGEEVITSSILKKSKRKNETVFVPHKLELIPEDNAHCISRGESTSFMNLELLKPEHIGHTYTYDDQEFVPDFRIVSDKFAAKKYDSIVYASAKNAIQHKHLMVPTNPNLHIIALTIFVAACHEHKKIFTLGHDSILDPSLINQITKIMKTYDDTEFIRVVRWPKLWCPNEFLDCENFKQIGVADYASEADLGKL